MVTRVREKKYSNDLERIISDGSIERRDSLPKFKVIMSQKHSAAKKQRQMLMYPGLKAKILAKNMKSVVIEKCLNPRNSEPNLEGEDSKRSILKNKFQI